MRQRLALVAIEQNNVAGFGLLLAQFRPRWRGPAWRSPTSFGPLGGVAEGQHRSREPQRVEGDVAIESCRTSALAGHVERCEDWRAHERVRP